VNLICKLQKYPDHYTVQAVVVQREEDRSLTADITHVSNNPAGKIVNIEFRREAVMTLLEAISPTARGLLSRISGGGDLQIHNPSEQPQDARGEREQRAGVRRGTRRAARSGNTCSRNRIASGA
jgi:hypothetical protein